MHRISFPTVVLSAAKQNWRNKKGRLRKRRQQVPSLLPSVVTILSLCLGLTALRFSLQGQWQFAVSSILFAAVLDALDGRLARFLGSASRFGAELDSLADLVNFGVVPAFVVYLRFFGSQHDLGWIAVLFFCTCMALRLARFNTYDSPQWAKSFSIGVPAPAGGFLILTPLIASFAWENSVWIHPHLMIIIIFFVGFLMISRVPTFVFKNIKISFQWLIPSIVGAFCLASFIYTMPWVSLVIFAFLYFLSFPFSARLYKKKKTLHHSSSEV